ncbi:HDOD domain-containing protein [Accumulibacter sp.]|uniref:HDOD domain-containing protein n=1 Tax=Accumulibacter sp. TaxID=2053492 RepID=UPI00261FE16D|nr:HDOD domain-containing protein [Accumulibacter sp.]
MHSLPESIRQAMESGRAPSPPQVLLRLMQMVDDDGTTMAELARLVEQDPGLCTRVLTAANSAAIRRGNELRSIESCLMALGTRLVRSIATCLSVQSLFDERTATRLVDLSAFWTHSLLIAELSRGLAIASGYHRPDEAYLAGLLHDVGELILLSALGDPYLQILATCTNETDLPVMETERFGAHHGEIGTWLADQWQLDSPFADGILFHHLPAEQIVTAAQLPQVVWLAHALSGCDEVPGALEELAERMFGQPGNTSLRALRDQAEQRMCVIADAIGMTPPDRAACGGAAGLPRVLAGHGRSETDAHGRIASLIGNQALMRPLQQNLFTLTTDAEVLFALRESARILFDLNRVAFLFCDPLDGRLTGKGISGQAAIFGQISILPEARRSLAAAAALSGRICSSYDRAPPAAESLMDMQFARALASGGLLCIPMIGDRRTVGVIVAGLSAGQHTLVSRRQPCLANFGRIAGISIDNWHETQSVRRQADEDVSARFVREARRVVHEASNPLTIIKGYLRILDDKLPPDAGVHRELTVLSEEIERVASIVRRMSAIPAAMTEDESLDICDLLRELLLLYRETLFDARGIVVDARLPPQAIRIAGDRNSLKQILVNLWKNASEALSCGQRVQLSLTDGILHEGRHFAELRFEDNGPGMSEAVISALHRPVDGRIGAARGLGLSIVGTLARQLRILVTCRSKEGQGTMISLLLPTANSAPQHGNSETQPR